MSEQSEGDAAPVEEAPVEEAVEATPVEAPQTEEDFDADVEANTIEIPTGEKLVPLSAVTNLREKLKDAKAGGKEAASLREQLAASQAQNAQLAPNAEAYRSMLYMQSQQPVAPAAPAAPTGPDPELVEIARDFDLYTPEGEPDLHRAQKHLTRETARAERISQAAMAPLVHQNVTTQARGLIERSKATKHPQTGEGLDPAILDGLFRQIASQPGGLQTLADPEQMKHLWVYASGLSPAAAAQVTKEALPPPMVRERAGGRTPDAAAPMSTSEKRAAKDAGMSEKEYLAIADKMPW